MNNKQFNLETALALREDYQGPRKATEAKDMQLHCENAVNESHEKHTCTFIFITVSISPARKMSFEEEWQAFAKMMPAFTNALSRNYLLAGAVVGVELYPKRKGRNNTRAGRPHAHMVLFVYNDFLNPSVFNIRQAFMQHELLDLQMVPMRLGIDTTQGYRAKSQEDNEQGKSSTYKRKVNARDVANQIRYCLKGATVKEHNPLLQPACKQYLGKSNLSIVLNPIIKESPLKPLIDYLLAKQYPVEQESLVTYHNIPAVRRYPDNITGNKMQMAEFIKAICINEGIAFYGKKLWKKPSGSHYTWAPWKSVSEFSTDILNVANMPTEYRVKFVQGAAWALNEGYEKNIGHTISVFPKLKLRTDLWEFNNGLLYDLSTVQISKTTEPLLSPSKHLRVNFEEIAFPYKALAFLESRLQDPKESLPRLLFALGGLFHEVEDRKTHPAPWIQGESSTFKTWFLNAYLQANFANVLIYRIPTQGPAQFKYGRLIGLEEGVVYIDDFKSKGFTDTTPLLNLLDGVPFVAEEKYKESELVTYKGAVAITTTETMAEGIWSLADRAAFANRFCAVTFTNQSTQLCQKNALAEIERDLPALGLLCNCLYQYQQNGMQQPHLPNTWKEIICKPLHKQRLFKQ